MCNTSKKPETVTDVQLGTKSLRDREKETASRSGFWEEADDLNRTSDKHERPGPGNKKLLLCFSNHFFYISLLFYNLCVTEKKVNELFERAINGFFLFPCAFCILILENQKSKFGKCKF